MTIERFLFPLAIIFLWQVSCYLELVPEILFPSPVGIFWGLKDLSIIGMPPGHLLHNHIFYSLLRVGWGFVIACFLGIPLGLFMGWSKRIREMVSPLFEIVRPIPPLAWIPIAILWFGIGMKSAVFIIFLGAFFPVLLNTMSGVSSMNPLLLEAAWSLNIRGKDLVLKLLLPASAPSIFVGVRIGLGIGWMTLVAAEFTGVKEGYGLGYMIMTARDIQRPDEIIAGMLIIGMIGFIMNYWLRAIEKRIIRWQ